MKRLMIVFVVLLVFSVLVAAEDLRFVREDLPNKHFVGPNGIYLALSHYNKNLTRDVVQSFESELQVFTPEFKERIKILTLATVSIFVVRADVIEKIIAPASSVPEIPSDGYLVIGHGRAAVGFMSQFNVGDKVLVRDYVPKYSSISKYPEIIISKNDDVIAIAGWNRGRCANDIVVYNSDYGDKTYNNHFGIEIAVEDDEVCEIRPYGTEAYIEIPKKGFLISTHGTMNKSVSSFLEGDFITLE